jgi:hypothetical protein
MQVIHPADKSNHGRGLPLYLMATHIPFYMDGDRAFVDAAAE